MPREKPALPDATVARDVPEAAAAAALAVASITASTAVGSAGSSKSGTAAVAAAAAQPAATKAWPRSSKFGTLAIASKTRPGGRARGEGDGNTSGLCARLARSPLFRRTVALQVVALVVVVEYLAIRTLFLDSDQTDEKPIEALEEANKVLKQQQQQAELLSQQTGWNPQQQGVQQQQQQALLGPLDGASAGTNGISGEFRMFQGSLGINLRLPANGGIPGLGGKLPSQEMPAGRMPAVYFRGAPWQSHVGRWFMGCGGESDHVTVQEALGAKRCPKKCSGNGVCNADLGECRCRHGYAGKACDELVDHPCNLPAIEGVFPYGMWVVSQCAAHCDHRTARCFCGPDTPHPMRPAVEPCGFLKDELGTHYEKLDKAELYSKSTASTGWCEADAQKVGAGEQQLKFECYCNYDGVGGPLCDMVLESFCINQCSGHGECHMGYCKCHDGWFGLDCSSPSIETPPSATLPTWVAAAENDAQTAAAGVAATAAAGGGREGEEGAESAGSGGGSQQTYKARHKVGDARQRGETRRRRPLVYVYDLPPEFTFHNIEGRKWRVYCASRQYNEGNETEWNSGWLYGSEAGVVEGFLSSAHRTSNPQFADYFFVPILGACIQARADDSPTFQMQGKFLGKRPNLVADFYLRAYEHIRQHYPYWNRTGGRDHIWLFPYDEGACYAPEAIWSSIMLTHWGNTGTAHPGVTSAYAWDDWSLIPFQVRGTHPCFDPQKDIVIPAWKAPHSAWRGGARPPVSLETRPLLFYFNGNLGFMHNGRPEPQYSMGIRQRVAELFGSKPNNAGQIGAMWEPGVEITNERAEDYSDKLFSSRFCGVFPGDGFSSRMADSMLHGCVPVIIQDGIQLPYETHMEYSEFAVRISEAEIPNMLLILKAIPEVKILSMLKAAEGIWQRFSYSSVARLEGKRQRDKGYMHAWANMLDDMTEDDAMATVFQILYYKLHTDEWRSELPGNSRPCAFGGQ